MTYNNQLTYTENCRTELIRTLFERGDVFVDNICDEMIRTMKSKGDDYAGSDRLANFKVAGELAGITAAQQCLSLIAVKVARLGTLLKSGTAPNNESILDSMKDLTVYTVLLQMIEQEPDNTPIKWWEPVKE